MQIILYLRMLGKGQKKNGHCPKVTGYPPPRRKAGEHHGPNALLRPLSRQLSTRPPTFLVDGVEVFPLCMCLRPYHLEYTSSRPITEVKQG